MKRAQITAIAFAAVVLTVLGGIALAQQDKYTLKVPGGLAFSEFRGYEAWQVVSVSEDGGLLAAIVANPAAVQALLANPAARAAIVSNPAAQQAIEIGRAHV